MPTSPPPGRDSERLRGEVLRGFVRRQGEGWCAADEAALRAWLDADAAHRAAHAQWLACWAAIDALPQEARAALRRRLLCGACSKSSLPPEQAVSRRAGTPAEKISGAGTGMAAGRASS